MVSAHLLRCKGEGQGQGLALSGSGKRYLGGWILGPDEFIFHVPKPHLVLELSNVSPTPLLVIIQN